MLHFSLYHQGDELNHRAAHTLLHFYLYQGDEPREMIQVDQRSLHIPFKPNAPFHLSMAYFALNSKCALCVYCVYTVNFHFANIEATSHFQLPQYDLLCTQFTLRTLYFALPLPLPLPHCLRCTLHCTIHLNMIYFALESTPSTMLLQIPFKSNVSSISYHCSALQWTPNT